MSFLDDFVDMLGAALTGSFQGSPYEQTARRRGGERRSFHNGDDDGPTILNVETDGEDDDPHRRTGAARHDDSHGPRGPRGPRRPRIMGGGGRSSKNLSAAQKAVLVIVVSLLVIFALLFGLDHFITDLMWYDQLGFQSVVWTQLWTKVGLWVAYALALLAVSYCSAWMAIRTRPDSPDGSTIRIHGDVVEVGRSLSSKTARRGAMIIALLVGILFGARFNSNWSEVLLMLHAQNFGIKDPQFGLDNGFYVFILPGLRLVLSGLMVLFVFGLVFSLVAHFAMGGIRISMPVHGHGIVSLTGHARRQVAFWVVLNMLLWSVRQIVGVFSNLTDDGSRFTGADYTTVHANIPVTFIMAALTAVLGILLGAWILRSRSLDSPASVGVRASAALKAWRVPIIAVAATIVISLVLGMLWPTVLQRFKVNPNEQEMESAYISRNIAATRHAYGLDGVRTEQYNATTKGRSGALASDPETTAQIRLLDPQVVSSTFKQMQQSKQYYSFPDSLAVDKYDIDGKSQDTVIAARELNLEGNDNRNWVNDHTVFTHGYGIVAAYGNKVTADGYPRFFESGIPTQGQLSKSQHYEPRIYFSPNSPDYSIVGSPKGSQPWEFDYPKGSTGASNTFQGNGGPKIGNAFTRLLYALRFGSDQIFFSDRVTSNSQILYDRSPKDRVAKVAPYLTLDGRVYPAVVNGRVKWIVDAYTTSDAYPYAQTTDLGRATEDSTTISSHTVKGLMSQPANYIRNSVKATVDAYDGSVDLYVWDKSDPVIKAWEKIFPGQYHPISDMSGDLMSHMRYPEGLFKVQRQLLSKYHVTSAGQFFSGEDFWQTPVDPTESKAAQSNDVLQPPYYLTLKTGGSSEPLFSLTSTYIPAGASTREILTGFLSVDSDAGSKKGEVGPNYGTIRLQELPKDLNVPGPGQAQTNFNTNPVASNQLNLLETGSTKLKRGNLLTLPLGGGLVYVQPVYVQSNSGTSYPLLKKVLVAFGDQVGFADTLDEALNQVFGGDSGASAGDAENSGGSHDSGVTSPDNGDGIAKSQEGGAGANGKTAPGKVQSGSGASGGSAASNPELKAALNRASQAMKDSDSAMKSGDWTAYGKAQKDLNDAINQAIELEGK
ncbi:UPF0182 family protein [Bifidobacterium bombi]|uniref:UPF0182 protein BBOMB_0223 n=1 Tax=Bifidobacterium bombi DSM 19703 TaxID=1341695 RepID=A0A080N1Z2_9BIFI|nr:UPF0182 family protein [Bifidobacterium bombi]KFF30903.1 integral membrane protein [Bifidobacterium bombi DSM 19703]